MDATRNPYFTCFPRPTQTHHPYFSLQYGMLRRLCAFCPAPATTGEHLWSNWVNPLVGEKKRYIIRRNRRIDGEERNWESVGLHLKFPVLCDPCNSKWGSEIETRMKNVSSLMVRDGMPKVLSASDIATIAVYSQLKTFVCDYGQDEVPSFYGSADRRAFRGDFTFPFGVNMWLARTFGTHGVFYGAYSKPPLETPKRFQIYIFMVSIGQLVIQVTSARWTKKSNRKYAPPPNLTQATFGDRFSILIWPNCVPPITWPPHEQMAGNFLDTFFDRWKVLNRTD